MRVEEEADRARWLWSKLWTSELKAQVEAGRVSGSLLVVSGWLVGRYGVVSGTLFPAVASSHALIVRLGARNSKY